MKKVFNVKILALMILLAISIVLLLNSDKIYAFAVDTNITNVDVGDILIDGDSVSIDEEYLRQYLEREGFFESSYKPSGSIYDNYIGLELFYNNKYGHQLAYISTSININRYSDCQGTITWNYDGDGFITVGSYTPRGIEYGFSCVEETDELINTWIVKDISTNCGNLSFDLRPAHSDYKISVNNDYSKGNLTMSDASLNIEKVKEGKTIQFSVSPEEGYKLSSLNITKDHGYGNYKNVSFIDNGSGNYSFTMPDDDVTISTTYEERKYNINVEPVEQTEDISFNIESITNVNDSTEVIFEVKPIRKYKLNDIKIVDTEGKDIEYNPTDKENEFRFIMPKDDVTIIPSYERIKYTVTIEDNEHTKDSKIIVEDPKSVEDETVVPFMIVPEDGYEVKQIYVVDTLDYNIEFEPTKNENEYQFIMPENDVIIKVEYEKIEEEIPEDPEPIEPDKEQEEVNEESPKTGDIIIRGVGAGMLGTIIAVATILLRKKYGIKKSNIQY